MSRLTFRDNVDMETEQGLLILKDVSFDMEGVPALRNQNFEVQKGKCYLIKGPSDTIEVFLLKTIAGILPYHDREGKIFFKGVDIYDSSDRELKEIKRQIAFVFSEGTLISNLTIRENLLLPIQYHRPEIGTQPALEKIKEGLTRFHIPDILHLRPADLSYSVKKKLSFVRASLLEPELIFLDKPVFNLDEQDRDQVLSHLEELRATGLTLVIVSQFRSLLKDLPDITVSLEDGTLKGV